MQFETISVKEFHKYIYENYIEYNISPLSFFKYEYGLFQLYNAGRMDLIENCAKIYGYDILNYTDTYQITILHKASELNLDITKKLIDLGGRVDIPDSKNNTAFHNICKNFSYKDMLILFEDMNMFPLCELTNDQGLTGLFIKMFKQEYESIEYLLQFEKNNDKKDNYGNTLLHYACEFNNKKLAELLVKDGVNKYIKNKQGLYAHSLLKMANKDMWELFTDIPSIACKICEKENTPARYYIKLPCKCYYSRENIEGEYITCCEQTYNINNFEIRKHSPEFDGEYYNLKFKKIIENLKGNPIPIINGVQLKTPFSIMDITQNYNTLTIYTTINELMPTLPDARKKIINTLLEFNGSDNKSVTGTFTLNLHDNIIGLNILNLDLMDPERFNSFIEFLVAYHMYVNKIIHSNIGNLISVMNVSTNMLPYHDRYNHYIGNINFDKYITDYFSKTDTMYALHNNINIKIMKEHKIISVYKKFKMLPDLASIHYKSLENILNLGYGIDNDGNIIYSNYTVIGPDIENNLKNSLGIIYKEIGNAEIRLNTKI